MGLMICSMALLRGNPFTRTLALMGARTILSRAHGRAGGHDNVRERTADCGSTILPVARESAWHRGVSNVGPITPGPWQGRKCIGNSLLIGPDGSEVARGPYGEKAEALLLREVSAS